MVHPLKSDAFVLFDGPANNVLGGPVKRVDLNSSTIAQHDNVRGRRGGRRRLELGKVAPYRCWCRRLGRRSSRRSTWRRGEADTAGRRRQRRQSAYVTATKRRGRGRRGGLGWHLQVDVEHLTLRDGKWSRKARIEFVS